LVDGSGLGFYFADDPGNPRPDAWCRDCDAVLMEAGDWNEKSQAFADIRLLCSCCYDDVKSKNCDHHFEFLCDSCSEIHQGIPGYGWRYPDDYFSIPELERAGRIEVDEDTCAIDGQFYFLRGTLEIPVIDGSESLVFGAWVSVSKASFDRYLQIKDTEEWQAEASMFGWLRTSIEGYPDTVNLKTDVYARGPEARPAIELQSSDHPLALQQRQGVFMKDLKDIYARVAPGKVNPIESNE
jgi:hypothetical protein